MKFELTGFQIKFIKSILKQLIKTDFIPLDKNQVEVIKEIIIDLKEKK